MGTNNYVKSEVKTEVEVILTEDQIKLIEQGNVLVTSTQSEYTIPQKFIKRGDKWYIKMKQ